MLALPTQEEMLMMSDRAWEIYSDKIVQRLTDADFGKNVAIDVSSGKWEIGDLEESIERLRSQLPDATIVNIYHEAPGSRAFSITSPNREH